MTLPQISGAHAICASLITALACTALLAGPAASGERSEAAPRFVTFDHQPSVEDLQRAFGLGTRAIIAAGSGDRLDQPAVAPAPVKTAKPAKSPLKTAKAKPAGKTKTAKPAIKSAPTPDTWVADRVEFANNSGAVLSSQLGVVDAIGALMRKQPDLVIIISGHANATGPHALNDHLSNRRAVAVRDYLARLYRLSPQRFVLRWMGAREPLPGLAPTAGANRRVQFGVLRG